MNSQKRNMILADIAIIFVAFIWGSGFAGNKILLNGGIHPIQLIAARFIIAAIILVLLFFKKLKANPSSFLPGALIGVILFISYMLQTIGLKYTTASNNAFLTSVYVVIVPVVAYFIIKRKPDIFNAVAAVLVLIGIAFLTVDFTDFSIGKSATFKGDMLTLLCAVFYAFQVTLIAHYARRHDPIVLAIVQVVVVAVLSTPAALFFEGTQFAVTASGIALLLYLALIATALCLVMQNVAQKYTTPTHAGLLMSLESVFGTLLGVVIMGDDISRQMGLGFSIIFIALIIAETKLSFLQKPSLRQENENL